jgi:hypothetical protein
MTDIVEKLAARLDKSVATIVVSHDTRTKRFIGEALLAGAALYLLKRYADKYLEAVGFDDMAKAHGRKTAEFLKHLQGETVTPQDFDAAKADLLASATLARTKPASASAQLSAQAEVAAVIVEAGAIHGQAREEAAKIAKEAETLFTD